MGAGMARSLRTQGHEVVAWNRTRAKAEPLADAGIEIADSVRQAADGADAVITMLFDTDATLAVSDELVGALAADAVWIQSGTVGPDGIARIAEQGRSCARRSGPRHEEAGRGGQARRARIGRPGAGSIARSRCSTRSVRAPCG